MSRIKDLQKYVHRDLESMKDIEKYAKAMNHLHGVSFAAVIIAKKRGVNSELAAMAGLLHDVYAYKNGSYDDHAHLGADYARKLLLKTGLATPEETEIICNAIWHHSDKDVVDFPLDEVIKTRMYFITHWTSRLKKSRSTKKQDMKNCVRSSVLSISNLSVGRTSDCVHQDLS